LLFLVIFEAGRYYNISDVQKIVGKKLLKTKFTKKMGRGDFMVSANKIWRTDIEHSVM